MRMLNLISLLTDPVRALAAERARLEGRISDIKLNIEKLARKIEGGENDLSESSVKSGFMNALNTKLIRSNINQEKKVLEQAKANLIKTQALIEPRYPAGKEWTFTDLNIAIGKLLRDLEAEAQRLDRTLPNLDFIHFDL